MDVRSPTPTRSRRAATTTATSTWRTTASSGSGRTRAPSPPCAAPRRSTTTSGTTSSAPRDPGGMALYVDGTRVASNSVTQAQSYRGVWHVGGDNLNSWPSAPTSRYFAGLIDEVAVYNSALSAQQVAAHRNRAIGLGDNTRPTTPTGVTSSVGETVSRCRGVPRRTMSGSRVTRSTGGPPPTSRSVVPRRSVTPTPPRGPCRTRTSAPTPTTTEWSHATLPATPACRRRLTRSMSWTPWRRRHRPTSRRTCPGATSP